MVAHVSLVRAIYRMLGVGMPGSGGQEPFASHGRSARLCSDLLVRVGLIRRSAQRETRSVALATNAKVLSGLPILGPFILAYASARDRCATFGLP